MIILLWYYTWAFFSKFIIGWFYNNYKKWKWWLYMDLSIFISCLIVSPYFSINNHHMNCMQFS